MCFGNRQLLLQPHHLNKRKNYAGNYFCHWHTMQHVIIINQRIRLALSKARGSQKSGMIYHTVIPCLPPPMCTPQITSGSRNYVRVWLKRQSQTQHRTVGQILQLENHISRSSEVDQAKQKFHGHITHNTGGGLVFPRLKSSQEFQYFNASPLLGTQGT